MTADFRQIHVHNERLIAAGEPLWIFLDDVPADRRPVQRPGTPAPEGWVRVPSAWELIGLLEMLALKRREQPAGLDLDHDLCVADESEVGERLPNGNDVLRHLAERLHADGVTLWPSEYLCVHAATVVGKRNMIGSIEPHAAGVGLARDLSEPYPTWRRA